MQKRCSNSGTHGTAARVGPEPPSEPRLPVVEVQDPGGFRSSGPSLVPSTLPLPLVGAGSGSVTVSSRAKVLLPSYVCRFQTRGEVRAESVEWVYCGCAGKPPFYRR